MRDGPQCVPVCDAVLARASCPKPQSSPQAQTRALGREARPSLRCSECCRWCCCFCCCCSQAWRAAAIDRRCAEGGSPTARCPHRGAPALLRVGVELDDARAREPRPLRAGGAGGQRASLRSETEATQARAERASPAPARHQRQGLRVTPHQSSLPSQLDAHLGHRPPKQADERVARRLLAERLVTGIRQGSHLRRPPAPVLAASDPGEHQVAALEPHRGCRQGPNALRSSRGCTIGASWLLLRCCRSCAFCAKKRHARPAEAQERKRILQQCAAAAMARYGVWMLERLVLRYSEHGGSSRGMRCAPSVHVRGTALRRGRCP